MGHSEDPLSSLPKTVPNHKVVIPSLLIIPFPMLYQKYNSFLVNYMLTLYDIQEIRKFLPNRL